MLYKMRTPSSEKFQGLLSRWSLCILTRKCNLVQTPRQKHGQRKACVQRFMMVAPECSLGLRGKGKADTSLMATCLHKDCGT